MKQFNRAYFAYEPTVIFQKDETWKFGREPVIRRMPDGSLVSLVYSGGEHEPDPENLILIVRSQDDGETWSKPEILFNHKGRCCMGTEIFTAGPRPIAFIHTYEYKGFFSELRASMTYSEDSGKTWSDPATLKGVPPNFCVRQGTVLSNGAWVFPVYWLEQGGDWNWKEIDAKNAYPKSWSFASGVVQSFDQGKSFKLCGYLSHPDGRSFWEPAIIELESGHVLMFMRCDGSGVIWKSESFDYGITWTSASATNIPNSGCKMNFLKIDGNIILVHNPCASGRRILELWVSDDNTASWKTKIRLAEAIGEDIVKSGPPTWVCYPHCFADEQKKLLYLACDSVDMHYLMKIPFADFLLP